MDELTRRVVRGEHRRVAARPDRPRGRLLFTALAMIAEFEGDVIRARTRESY
ncbi:recombinase family protein [Rathayibacter caricis]|uniref:recombinase family protein n=1 Tax=Rathayibacter caricis TaxID=110936 RepID=UPI001B873496